MTPEQFKRAMQHLHTEYLLDENDPERFHGKADDLMCKVLKKQGYTAGIEIFEASEKWYA